MSYVLLIVDMQPQFPAASGKTIIKNCKREIRKAMQEKASIIFLEYMGCGTTNDSLLSLTDGYEQVWTQEKSSDDGSDVASSLIWKYSLSRTHIKVCGVNTDCCVKETVRGLISVFPKAEIDVIGDACNSDWDHGYGLSSMKKMPNVNVKGGYYEA